MIWLIGEYFFKPLHIMITIKITIFHRYRRQLITLILSVIFHIISVSLFPFDSYFPFYLFVFLPFSILFSFAVVENVFVVKCISLGIKTSLFRSANKVPTQIQVKPNGLG